MKRGDLVRMKYDSRQYDSKLRVRVMKEGSLGIILGFLPKSKQTPTFAQVFVDGQTWELNMDYFEKVQ